MDSAAIIGLAGALGGGVLGVIGTLITTRGARKAARETARAEHESWLRDRRAEVFKEVSLNTQRLVAAMDDDLLFASLVKDFDRYLHEVRLVGPRWVFMFVEIVAMESEVASGVRFDPSERARNNAKRRLPDCVEEMTEELGKALENPRKVQYVRRRFIPLSEGDGIRVTPDTRIARIQLGWYRKKEDALWLIAPWRQVTKTFRNMR